MSLLKAGLPGRLAILALARQFGVAEPYRPRQSSDVLERLPARSDPAQREIAPMHARVQQESGNVAVGAALERRYIGIARYDGDPRYLGYGQAALCMWRETPSPPTEVRGFCRIVDRQADFSVPSMVPDYAGRTSPASA